MALPASLLFFAPPCGTGFSSPGSDSTPVSPQFCLHKVQESTPAVHRLRLFGLSLGPDFPRADQLYPGILRYSAWRIPTSISLLIPAFSLHVCPRLLSVPLRSYVNAPLPVAQIRGSMLLHGFGVVFQPRVFSAQDLSASELLRTL